MSALLARKRGCGASPPGSRAGHHLTHLDAVDGHSLGRHRSDHLARGVRRILGLPDRHRQPAVALPSPVAGDEPGACETRGTTWSRRATTLPSSSLIVTLTTTACILALRSVDGPAEPIRSASSRPRATAAFEQSAEDPLSSCRRTSRRGSSETCLARIRRKRARSLGVGRRRRSARRFLTLDSVANRVRRTRVADRVALNPDGAPSPPRLGRT
jgi:hypothetical protein